jgi:hypothetical protein
MGSNKTKRFNMDMTLADQRVLKQLRSRTHIENDTDIIRFAMKYTLQHLGR